MTRHQENHTAAAESVVEAILPPPSLWVEQCQRLSLTQFEHCGNAFFHAAQEGVWPDSHLWQRAHRICFFSGVMPRAAEFLISPSLRIETAAISAR